jgi:ribosome recycling factor
MADKVVFKEIEKRMDGAVQSFKQDLAGLRSGRATTAMVEPINVSVYGSQMPLNQVATLSTPEPRTITVSVWDKGNVGAVEKAIRESGLGVNPVVDGTTIRIPIPPLTEDRRKELAKLAGKYAENARVAVRNVRRDGMDQIKKSDMAEDEAKRSSEEIQRLTDAKIKAIDEALSAKEQEIMQV